jgi:hypothetical protein
MLEDEEFHGDRPLLDAANLAAALEQRKSSGSCAVEYSSSDSVFIAGAILQSSGRNPSPRLAAMACKR